MPPSPQSPSQDSELAVALHYKPRFWFLCAKRGLPVRVKGKGSYLYRAVDSTRATIDFRLSAKRDAGLPNDSFRKRYARPIVPLHASSMSINVPPIRCGGAVKEGRATAPPLSAQAGAIFEQYPGTGSSSHQTKSESQPSFRSFWGAWRTIAGYEAVNMIRRGQARWVGKGEVVRQLCLIAAMFSLTR